MSGRNSAGDSCLTVLIMLPILLILEIFSGGKKKNNESTSFLKRDVTLKGCLITIFAMYLIGLFLEVLIHYFGQEIGLRIFSIIFYSVILFFVFRWIRNKYKAIVHPTVVLNSPEDLNSSNLDKIANNKIETLYINYTWSYLEENPFHILRDEIRNITFNIILGPNVVSTSCMFSDCTKLIEISSIDTSKITDMSGMFRNCKSMVNAPELDMSHVVNTNLMFSGCSSLKFIPKYNTPSLVNLTGMFDGCTNIKTLPKFNISAVPQHEFNLFQQSIKQTFANNLNENTRESWGLVVAVRLFSPNDITFVTEQLIYKNLAEYIFIDYQFCRPRNANETRRDYLKWLDKNNPFYRVRKKLSEIKVPIRLGPKVTSLSNMFVGCTELRSIHSIVMNNVTDCSYMFGPIMNKDTLFGYESCSKLTQLPVTINTSQVTNFEGMFLGCSGIKTIPKMNFNNAENLKIMFAECSSLEHIGQIIAPKAVDVSHMFYDCDSLLRMPDVQVASDAITTDMFLGTKFS